MSTPKSTQDKSVQPDGIENKALAPATEDKAAAPAGVNLILSTHYDRDGEHYLPGDPINVPEDVADSLVIGGFAKRA